MDKPETPKTHKTEPWEADIVELLEEHIREAETHELHHKALAAEPKAHDHEHRHADPLKPASHFSPDPHQKKSNKKTRDIL